MTLDEAVARAQAGAREARILELERDVARLKRAAGEDRLTIQVLREDLRARQDSAADALDGELSAAEQLVRLQGRVRELGEALELGEGERRWEYLRVEFADLFGTEAP